MNSNIELLSNDELKEQQIINDLQLKINKQKEKVSKKETRQKILLGTFLADSLNNDRLKGLREFTADNLLDYLTRETDKELMKGLVEKLNNINNEKEHQDNNSTGS